MADDPPQLYDVIVVGFGPVGATLAGLLATRGHSVLVVEATDCSKTSPRAINMDDESMRLLVHQLGLGVEWERTTRPFPGGNFVTGYRPKPAWLGIGVVADEGEDPLFGKYTMPKGRSGFHDVVFYQPELEKQLRARIDALRDKVTLLLDTKVVAFREDARRGRVAATTVPAATTWRRTEGGEWIAENTHDACAADERTYHARFLVACDGAKSTFRRIFAEPKPVAPAAEPLSKDDVVDGIIVTPPASPLIGHAGTTTTTTPTQLTRTVSPPTSAASSDHDDAASTTGSVTSSSSCAHSSEGGPPHGTTKEAAHLIIPIDRSYATRGSLKDNVTLGHDLARAAGARLFDKTAHGEAAGTNVVRRRTNKLVFAHYDEQWLVVDVKLTERGERQIGTTLPHIAQQICDETRPATIVPGSYVWEEDDAADENAADDAASAKTTTKTPRRHYRWEFLLSKDADDPLRMVDDAAIYALLCPTYGQREDFEVVRAATYAARGMDAVFWESPDGLAFLCGDAAHTTPPFLGQGLNQGLRDANNLAWKLDFALRGLASPRILATYMVEERPVSTHMTLGACDVGRKLQFFQRAAKIGEAALAQAVAELADKANPHTYGHVGGKWGAPTMPKLMSALVSTRNPDDSSYAGYAMLQEEVDLGNGGDDDDDDDDEETAKTTTTTTSGQLLDAYFGGGFSLVVDADGPAGALPCASPRVARDFETLLDGTVVALPTSRNGGVDACLGGIFTDHVGILVRPDRIVYGVARDSAELDAMIQDLIHVLRRGPPACSV